jgi:molybdenum cofactor cytidylyltransferase
MTTILHRTAAIILAAGSSSRMGGGRHKLLLPLHDRPVLAHVLNAVLASQARPVVLVLGHQPEQVRSHIAPHLSQPDLHIVENPDYLQGMSTSMRLGIQTLQANGYTKYKDERIDSALVLLGDQPLITAQHIDALIAVYRTTGKRIIAPIYEGKRGNPILFDASLFPELLEVTGDEGGRSVLERHRDEIATVEIGNPLANIDVDTWDAYQRVVEAWEQKKAEK